MLNKLNVYKILKFLHRDLSIIKWMIWDFTGLRAIKEKIIPPKDISTGARKPSSFIIWFIGIYAVLYGVAFQNYEKNINSINNKIESISNQIATPYYKFALSKIPQLQNMLMVPVEPEIFNPLSVFNSLFGKKKEGTQFSNSLKRLVEVCKDSLDNVNFNEIDISFTNLDKANMRSSMLWGANCMNTSFRFANLEFSQFDSANVAFCNFESAKLKRAWFSYANLTGSNFSGADLRNSQMIGANFSNTFLMYASFIGADLRGIKNYSICKMSMALSFYNAVMDTSLENQLKMKCPELLKKPDQEVVDTKSLNLNTKY